MGGDACVVVSVEGRGMMGDFEVDVTTRISDQLDSVLRLRMEKSDYGASTPVSAELG